MAVTLLNPEGLPIPPGDAYAQVAVARPPPRRPRRARRAARAEEIAFVPAPASLIEVVSLFEQGVLVEIEATAILD